MISHTSTQAAAMAEVVVVVSGTSTGTRHKAKSSQTTLKSIYEVTLEPCLTPWKPQTHYYHLARDTNPTLLLAKFISDNTRTTAGL